MFPRLEHPAGYVRATNLYFALAQHEKKDLVFLSAGYTSSQATSRIALDLECLSQNPCCP